MEHCGAHAVRRGIQNAQCAGASNAREWSMSWRKHCVSNHYRETKALSTASFGAKNCCENEEALNCWVEKGADSHHRQENTSVAQQTLLCAPGLLLCQHISLCRKQRTGMSGNLWSACPWKKTGLLLFFRIKSNSGNRQCMLSAQQSVAAEGSHQVCRSGCAPRSSTCGHKACSFLAWRKEPWFVQSVCTEPLFVIFMRN